MPRKPKMPKYVGPRMADGRIGPAVYTITMDIVPTDLGIDNDATNAEMVRGLTDHINAKITKAREAARAEGETTGLARALAAVEARAAAREAQVDAAATAGGEADAVRLKAGELRAVAEDIRRAGGGAPPTVTP